MTVPGDFPQRPQHDAGTLLADRYRIVRKLRASVTGSVYLAEDQRLANRLVAVKEIIDTIIDEGDRASAIEYFNREAELLARLDHPAIPAIYDYFLDNDRRLFYVVFKYIDGVTMSQRQKDLGGRINEEAVTRWAIEICDVLDYLHSQKPPIIYRDLKPENLMLDARNRVTLVEFGIARIIFPVRKGVTAIGTMGYAPPELFSGEVEPASDVYSLGATVFHLLTGRDPQDDPLLIFDFTKNPKPRQLNPELTLGIEALICRAVEYRPEDRWPSIREFGHELEKHLRKLNDFRTIVGGSDAIPEGSPRGAPTGVDSWEEAATPKKPVYLVDNVQFTVFQPKQIRSERWYPFLAFAHLSERSPDAPAGEPDPIEEMQRQAQSILGEQMSNYRTALQDSSQGIPKGGTLTFVPSVPGIEFNPPSRNFVWHESVHREEFRMRASPELMGESARGSLSVFLGSILLAEINLKIAIAGKDDALEQESSWSTSQAQPYRKIFASYSQKDKFIVEQFEVFGRALGDEYLRDLTKLRSGEVWGDRLMDMIRAADIFQLFWSNNSMKSAFVNKEWHYALTLGRSNFIRPVYWEIPLPQDPVADLPPEALRKLHFQNLNFARTGGTVAKASVLFRGIIIAVLVAVAITFYWYLFTR